MSLSENGYGYRSAYYGPRYYGGGYGYRPYYNNSYYGNGCWDGCGGYGNGYYGGNGYYTTDTVMATSPLATTAATAMVTVGGYGCRTAFIPYGWTWYRATSC